MMYLVINLVQQDLQSRLPYFVDMIHAAGVVRYMQHWLDSRDVSGKLEPANEEQDLGMHRCAGNSSTASSSKLNPPVIRPNSFYGVPASRMRYIET